MKRSVFGLMLLVAIASLAATLPAQAIPSKSAAQALKPGDVQIIASWMIGNTFKASTTLVHVTPGPLATLTVVLPTTLQVGQSVCPIAVGKDQFGNPHTGDPITWKSSDTTVVKIGPSTLACPASDTTVAAPPLSLTLVRSPFQSATRIR